MSRIPVIATVAAGFLVAALPPAVAAAAPAAPCTQWGFNGDTSIVMERNSGLGTIEFTANGTEYNGHAVEKDSDRGLNGPVPIGVRFGSMPSG